MTEPSPVENLSYEAARDELIQLVRNLEAGNAPLQQALQWWERAEELAKHCQGILDRAQQKMATSEAE